MYLCKKNSKIFAYVTKKPYLCTTFLNDIHNKDYSVVKTFRVGYNLALFVSFPKICPIRSFCGRIIAKYRSFLPKNPQIFAYIIFFVYLCTENILIYIKFSTLWQSTSVTFAGTNTTPAKKEKHLTNSLKIGFAPSAESAGINSQKHNS